MKARPAPLKNLDPKTPPPSEEVEGPLTALSAKAPSIREKNTVKTDKLDKICEVYQCKADTATISDSSTYSGFSFTSQGDVTSSSASSIQIGLSSCNESSIGDYETSVSVESVPTRKVKSACGSIFRLTTKSFKYVSVFSGPVATLPLSATRNNTSIDLGYVSVLNVAPTAHDTIITTSAIKNKRLPKVLRRKPRRSRSTPNLLQQENTQLFLSPEDLGKVNAYYAPVPVLPKTPMSAQPQNQFPARVIPPVPTRPVPSLPTPTTPIALLSVGFPMMPESIAEDNEDSRFYLTLNDVDWSTGDAILVLLDNASARIRADLEEGSLEGCAGRQAGGSKVKPQRLAHTSLSQDEWKRILVPDEEVSFLTFD